MNANVSLLSPLISLSACTWKNLKYQNAAGNNVSLMLAFCYPSSSPLSNEILLDGRGRAFQLEKKVRRDLPTINPNWIKIHGWNECTRVKMFDAKRAIPGVFYSFPNQVHHQHQFRHQYRSHTTARKTPSKARCKPK
jgi:hypothetical protein